MTDPVWYRIHFRKVGSEVVVAGEAERDRILARKSPKAINVEVAKVHECGICGKREAWGPTWEWYGSYQQVDDGVPPLKFCSPDCRRKHKEPPKERGKGRSTYRPHDDRGTPWGKLDKARKEADPRKFPMPVHPKEKSGDGFCTWCGDPVEKPRRSWHPRCLEIYYCHTRLESQVAFVSTRDGFQCAICQGGEAWKPILSGWGPDKGQPVVFSATTRMGQEFWGDWCPVHHVSNDGELEYDHIVPLWEVADLDDDDRRPFFGPENGWLLCKKHHRAKTKQEAARRAAQRREA